MGGFSGSEKAIVKAIENDPESFLGASITAFSKRSFVSPAAVTRFAKRIGHVSYKGLQLWVAKETARRRLDTLDEGDKTAAGAINNIRVYYKHSLDTTAESLVPADMETFGSLLTGASVVYTFGLGTSDLAATQLERNLNILNINVRRLGSIHDLVLWVDLSKTPKTLVVVFSHTMRTAEVRSVLRACADYGIMTIVVTADGALKEQAKLLKIKYNTFEGVDEPALRTLTSKAAQLYIVDIVTTMAAAKKKAVPRMSRTYLDS